MDRLPKFQGTFAELDAILRASKIVGAWYEPNVGLHQYRLSSKAYLSWWPSTGKMLIQGKAFAAQQLHEAVEYALHKAGALD